jgi:hypothetical protein
MGQNLALIGPEFPLESLNGLGRAWSCFMHGRILAAARHISQGETFTHPAPRYTRVDPPPPGEGDRARPVTAVAAVSTRSPMQKLAMWATASELW